MTLQTFAHPSAGVQLSRAEWEQNNGHVGGVGFAIGVASNDAATRIKNFADYIGDGTRDDVEILAAIALLASTGGIVVLSGGGFSCGADIVLPANVTLECHSSTITFTGDFTIRGDESGAGHVKRIQIIGNLIVDCNSVANYGVSMKGVEWSTFEHIEVKNAVITGFLISSFQDSGSAWRRSRQNDWNNIIATDCPTGIHVTKDSSDTATSDGSNFNRFWCPYVQRQTEDGMWFEWGEGCTVYSSRSLTPTDLKSDDSTPVTGIRVSAGADVSVFFHPSTDNGNAAATNQQGILIETGTTDNLRFYMPVGNGPDAGNRFVLEGGQNVVHDRREAWDNLDSDSGTESKTSDGSGDITIAHGQDYTPALYSCNIVSTSAYVAVAVSADGTNIVFRIWDIAAGAVKASTAFTVQWSVKRTAN